MAKSLTETAKAILMNEGSIPSVSSSDNNPDRDVAASNPNMASLKPKSKVSEADPKSNEAQDLGPALVKQGDVPPSAKAATATSKVKARPADKVGGDMKPAKAEMMEEDLEVEEETLEEDFEISEELASFIDTLVAEGFSEEEIAEAIEENFEFGEDAELMEEVSEELAEEEVSYEVDMSEHVEALLEGEELSEEFKQKALTIFEAAVKQKVEAEIALMEQAFAETLEEEVAAIQEELSSNVDDYLNYVTEQWINENEVAIEAGLRTELTEDFISGLKTLFAEHYIDIPEDKVSVIEELGAQVEALEAKLNEEIDRSVTLNKMLAESKKFEVIASAVDGLTDTQAEKLKSLAESVEFTSVDEFATKVTTIRENYFPTGSVKSDNVLDKAESSTDGKGMIAEELQGPMAAYVKTLGRKLPN